MTRTLEDLKEKNVNFWFRLALRFMAWGTLMVMMIYKMWIPMISDPCGNGVELNSFEKYLMGGAIALILTIEGVKFALEQYLKKKSQ